jgi:hypothetical protein
MSDSIINITEAIIKRFIEKERPPVDIRDKLDIGYSFDGKVLQIFEIRPKWDNPSEIMHSPFAKIRYIKSSNVWKLYWMRASGKWESYQPLPKSTHLEKLLDCITEDHYSCFKG